MTDLLILAGLVWWLCALALWRMLFEGTLVLAACLVFERLWAGPEPDPEPELPRLAVAELTVADVRWGRCNWVASKYELVHP